MKRILLASLLALGAAALAAEPMDVTKDWQAMPVRAAANADVAKALPENGAWTDGAALAGRIPLAEGAKAGNNLDGEFNAWYRRSVEVPKEWLAGSVRFEQALNYCDLVVFANGRKAGVAFHPDGAVELAPFLRAGKNEIKVFATNRGFGTGERGIVYHGRDEALLNAAHFVGPARLVPRSAAFVEDVYAEPSWREKKLTLHVSIHAAKDRTVDLAAEISDDAGRDPATKKLRDGKVVKTTELKGVKAKAGDTEVAIEIPWADAVPWEPVADTVPWAPVDDPRLYACRVSMTDGGAPADAPEKFLFGFREIWREGKEIVLNGHVQRFRGFWDQGLPENAADVHRFGFNLAYRTHRHESVLAEDPALMERLSRAGVAVFAGMPTIYYVHEAVRRDPDCEAQWRRHLRHWMRSARNWPCVVAASCGVNQICPERNMRPEILGQDPETGGVVENIEFARRAARELHPNCLYFSHADGTEADLSSSNLYFNFTPLQEREEWLSSWATNGILPWYAAEFGAPYYACWFHSRVPEMTEWLAAYYGDAAYVAESEDMLRLSKDFAKSCLKHTHGGWVDKKDLYEYNSLAEEYSRMLVRRTNRAWRAFGLNGGLMYLISWPWKDGDRIAERQRLANGDLVCFLGGAPDFVDRTHAYRAGETIEKQLAFVWDGLGEKVVGAKWKFVDAFDGTVVASGSETVELRQGDIVFRPVSVVAPAVRSRTFYRFEVEFLAAPYIDATVKSDTFHLEVFPAETPRVRTGFKVALYDPEGDTAAVLEALRIPFERSDSLAAAIADKTVQALVVGRRALSRADGLEAALPRVEKGLRLFVAQQDPATWQAMGFTVEDSMARQMRNVSLHGVDDADLAHWRGSPMADAPFGNAMKHDTRRGPRWTHRHAVSSTPLLIPGRGGFRPLVRGEFDLSYSPLLQATRGLGAVTFCTLDFEGRVGADGCPAATAVAAATFENFFEDKPPIVGNAAVYTDGAHAKRLAEALGLDAQDYAGDRVENGVLVVGKDSALTKPQIENALGINARVLVLANDRLARETGLAAADARPEPFFRAEMPSGFVPEFADLFADVGPSLLRWRDGVDMLRLAPAGGYKVAGSGEFALSPTKSILFDSVDPFQACDRYGEKAADIAHGGWGRVPKDEKDLYLRNASQSEDNAMRRLALMLGRWGVGAGAATLGRALYTKPAVAFEPIAQYNVLGPWPSPRDDSAYMVDGTVDGKPGPFPVDPDKKGDSGATAEAMAIRGDVQPNPRFRPLYLDFSSQPKDFDFIDWRPVVKSNPDGLVEYSKAHELIAAQSFCTCYCVGYLPRETDGEITLRFGIDWRGKVWVNGKEVCKTYGGKKDEGSIVVGHIPVYAMSNKDDAKHGTFDGRNVITVKAGCGQGAKVFYLNVSKEVLPGELVRKDNPAYDGVSLYATRNPAFDPYEYVYW